MLTKLQSRNQQVVTQCTFLTDTITHTHPQSSSHVQCVWRLSCLPLRVCHSWSLEMEAGVSVSVCSEQQWCGPSGDPRHRRYCPELGPTVTQLQHWQLIVLIRAEQPVCGLIVDDVAYGIVSSAEPQTLTFGGFSVTGGAEMTNAVSIFKSFHLSFSSSTCIWNLNSTVTSVLFSAFAEDRTMEQAPSSGCL